MKAYSILLLFLSTQSLATVEFAPIGATWYYTNYESFIYYGTGYVKIESVKDTLVQGKNCRKLTKTRYGSDGSSTQESNEIIYQNGDTIFNLADNDQFYVLYNFNAQPGDEWTTRTYEVYAGNEAVIHVDSISSIVINGESLKVYYISSDMNGLGFGYEDGSSLGKGYIIEKLGGFWYMFPQNYALWDGEIRKGLRCYSDSEFGSYESGISSNCSQIITSLKDKIGSYFTISPNPSDGRFKIDISSPFVSDFFIYSSQGVLLDIEKIEFSKEEVFINIHKPGVYFLQGRTKNEKYFSEKIIIE